MKNLLLGLRYFLGESEIPFDTLLNPAAPEVLERIGPVRRITVPTVHFSRLDQDGDGHISAADLIVLQSPIHLSVRANAILAAFDLDGDGTLSADEFQAAFE